MNQGPDFQPRADDEADRDPLLGALRQRLGEGIGQEPPPELWASIRQQLPAAAPRPWWLRSRRLLALLVLLGGVLLGGLAVWLAGPKPTSSPLAHRPATGPGAASPGPVATRPGTSNHSSLSTTSSTAPRAGTSLPAATRGSSARSQGSPATQVDPAALVANPAAASKQALAATRTPRATASALGEASGTLPAAGSTRRRTFGTTHYPARALASSGAKRQRTGRATEIAGAATVGRRQPAISSRTGAAAPKPAGFSGAAVGAASVATGQATASVSTEQLVATSAHWRARHTSRPTLSTSADHQLANPALAGTLAASTQRHRRAKRRLAAPRVAATQDALPTSSAPGLVAALAPPAPLDSLAWRRASLLQQALALPAPLAARPDSAGPWLPRARRWSVLALVGPTISYRTTGQLFSPALSFTPTPTNTATFLGSGSSSSSLVELERPAAGLGAQVQVRRVLTGRWSLALGAGYQEYATRLALQVTRRAVATPTNSVFDSTFTVHQRDTYRLLTLPVQLSYALGPPRGRLSLGLLAGFEPSLYVGGRTTEGSSCNCQQQVFTSASGSPYNALSLGLSLGLDARYRLGGPASRWQWVLQPTGRYVASPFVRSSTLYVRRQPYSFGLLTGLAWEF